MKVVRIITVVGIACCALALSSTANAVLVFEEHFEAYASGENIIGQNGWYGWEDPATPVVATAVGPTLFNMSARLDPAGAGWQNFSNDVEVDSSMGPKAALLYKSYYPANSSGLLWVAFGDWKVQISQKTGTHGLGDTLHIGDDSGLGVPGSMPYVADTWGEVEIVIDWEADTASMSYNGTVFSERTDFTEESLKTVDFLTTPTSWGDGLTGPVYIDDIVLKVVPEPSTLALLGLAGLGLALRRRRR